MEKYQIPGTSISFRLNNEERKELNQLAVALQEKNNVMFGSAKDFFMAVVDELVLLKANPVEPETVEVEVEKEVIPGELQSKFAEIKASIFDNEELSEVQMIDTLVQIVNTPQEAVEIEVEKVVERQLSETEILVNLHPEQKRFLGKIAEWRQQSGHDQVLKSESEVMVGMTFNRASIINMGGDFATGISPRQFDQLNKQG